MKKMNNKGFSLVELIIVIAIMAILAGAIAPALIRYIDKSRKSNDVSSCKTIKTAVETAMANEDTYELLTTAGATIVVAEDRATTGGAGVTIYVGSGTSNEASDSRATAAKEEIGKNIGENTPKVKYRKEGADEFVVQITTGGTVKVGMSNGSQTWWIAPDMDALYQ